MTSQLQEIPSSAGHNFFQTNSQRRAELANDIVSAGLIRGDSGTPGPFHLDRYLFETKPTVLRRLASLLCERVPARVDRLAAVGTGAVILATALSLESGIPFVVGRKRPETGDAYAAGAPVTGEYHPGERALLVADVIADGSEIVSAATLIRAEGMITDRVLTVIDQEQGAADTIREASLCLDALFTITSLVQEVR